MGMNQSNGGNLQDEPEMDFLDAVEIPDVSEFDAIVEDQHVTANEEVETHWTIQQQKLQIAASLIADVQQSTQTQHQAKAPATELTLESLLSSQAPRPTRGVNSAAAAEIRSQIMAMVGLGAESQHAAAFLPAPPSDQVNRKARQEPQAKQEPQSYSIPESHPSSNPLLYDEDANDIMQQWAMALTAASNPNPDNYITEQEATKFAKRQELENKQELERMQSLDSFQDLRRASRSFQRSEVKMLSANQEQDSVSASVGSKRPRSPSIISAASARTETDGAMFHMSNLEISGNAIDGEDLWAWHNETLHHVPCSRANGGDTFKFVDSNEHRSSRKMMAIHGQAAADLANLLNAHSHQQLHQPQQHRDHPLYQHPKEVEDDQAQIAISSAMRLFSNCDKVPVKDTDIPSQISEPSRLQNYRFSEFIPGVKARRGRPQTNFLHQSGDWN